MTTSCRRCWSPPAYGLFCSDSAYGDVNGDGLPEIAVGRLPVRTSDQLLGGHWQDPGL